MTKRRERVHHISISESDENTDFISENDPDTSKTPEEKVEFCYELQHLTKV